MGRVLERFSRSRSVGIGWDRLGYVGLVAPLVDAEGEIAFGLELVASTFRAVPAPPGAVTMIQLDQSMEAMEADPGLDVRASR